MKTTFKILATLFICTSVLQAQVKQEKTPLQLAEQYYAQGEYHTAAGLYEQFLNPPKNQKTISDFPLNIKSKRNAGTNLPSRPAILLRQADCYRLSHNWEKAKATYKLCLEQDPGQYAEALYWYGICDRSLGNYASAETSIKEFLTVAGTNNIYRKAAERELHTLDYIKQQITRSDSVLVKLNKLNAPNGSELGIFAPVHVSGNQFLISSTLSIPVQSKDINPYASRLFYASLRDNNLEDISPVETGIADAISNQGAATISADGKYLYLSQWKKENGVTISAIYYSVKETAGWSKPVLLQQINVAGRNSKQPFCTSDGKYLFFASDRPGGSGKFDIWYAPLNSDGTTGEPVNAGGVVNTADDEQAPFYHNSSATLVFSSNGKLGMGGYDLFTSKGTETTWAITENLGHPVNSSRDDIYFYAPEKASLLSNAIFSSDRGSGCCLETYIISKAPKSRQFKGIVRDCNDNTAIANASIILKNTTGAVATIQTDADGKYSFSLKNEDVLAELTVQKEAYIEKTSASKIIRTDESDLLIDHLTNEDICIEKIPPPPPPVEEVLVIKAEDVVTVYFDFDKSVLRPEVRKKLDSIYTVMTDNLVTTIQISGYTDGLGSDEYNAKLSDRRARACANYLLKKGIEKDRIRFVSFGKCCPVEMEIINGRDNPEGRSLNRRALINVKKD